MKRRKMRVEKRDEGVGQGIEDADQGQGQEGEIVRGTENTGNPGKVILAYDNYIVAYPSSLV